MADLGQLVKFPKVLRELTMPKGGLDHFHIRILSHMEPSIHLIWAKPY